MIDFDELWQRIVLLQGETFHQKTGKPFTYTVSGNSVCLRTTNRQLPRSHFARAVDRAPLDGPGQLQDLQGPSYLFAVLSDPRVTGDKLTAPASRPIARPENGSGADDGWGVRDGLAPEAETRVRRGMLHPAESSGLDALRLLDPRRVLLITACSAAKARGGRPAATAAQPGWPEALREARASVLATANTGPGGELLPAWRRYTGTFYRYAGPVLSEAVARGNVVIISGGYGVVRAGEPIAWYNKVLHLADWPAGLLESMLVEEARRGGLDTVVAFVSATTAYAQLLRRTYWRAAGLNAYLVTITGVAGGAMFEVPRRLGLAFCAFWNQQDGEYPPGTVAEHVL
jgi:hypothetical protein